MIWQCDVDPGSLDIFQKAQKKSQRLSRGPGGASVGLTASFGSSGHTGISDGRRRADPRCQPGESSVGGRIRRRGKEFRG